MDADFNIKEIHKKAPITQLVEQLICNHSSNQKPTKTNHKSP